jgi:hypothetical protein
MRKTGTTKRKSEAQKLADDVRLLDPLNDAEAYRLALNIITADLPTVSAADIFASKGSTAQDCAALAREVATILFPLPPLDKTNA